MRRWLGSALVVAVAVAASGQGALGFEHGGVSVTPVAGYLAEAADQPPFTVTIAIRSTGNVPRTTEFMVNRACGLSYTEWPDDHRYRALPQAEINALTVGPGMEEMKALLAPGTVFSEGTRIVGDISWLELTVSMDREPGLRIFQSNSMTPAGTYTMTCATHEDEFDGVLAAFQMMRNSVTGPR